MNTNVDRPPFRKKRFNKAQYFDKKYKFSFDMQMFIKNNNSVKIVK